LKPTSLRSNFAQMGRKLPEEVLRDLLVDLSNNLPYKTIVKRRYTTRMTVKRTRTNHTRKDQKLYWGNLASSSGERTVCFPSLHRLGFRRSIQRNRRFERLALRPGSRAGDLQRRLLKWKFRPFDQPRKTFPRRLLTPHDLTNATANVPTHQSSDNQSAQCRSLI
jgi:hypothetical protein